LTVRRFRGARLPLGRRQSLSTLVPGGATILLASIRRSGTPGWYADGWRTGTRSCLAPYFRPPLDDTEARQARMEGWILGAAW